MLLFLDFDGVLHPEPADTDELFSCAPMLWKILRACPSVDVVFSTSWRTQHSVDELINFVTNGGGEDLAHRFIGATPVLADKARYETKRGFVREDECLAWLVGNGRQDQRWLAVDDFRWFFSPKSHGLFVVDYQCGLTEADAASVSAILLL